jgi:hypothetical protein
VLRRSGIEPSSSDAKQLLRGTLVQRRLTQPPLTHVRRLRPPPPSTHVLNRTAGAGGGSGGTSACVGAVISAPPSNLVEWSAALACVATRGAGPPPPPHGGSRRAARRPIGPTMFAAATAGRRDKHAVAGVLGVGNLRVTSRAPRHHRHLPLKLQQLLLLHSRPTATIIAPPLRLGTGPRHATIPGS